MAYSLNNLKILVIEDNAGDLLLIEEYLAEEIKDPAVSRAENFSMAMEILTSGQQFDAVLLDLTLPDASRETLINPIVQAAGDTPVIVLTGYNEKEFSIKTLSLGIADYLLKDELTAPQLYKSISYSIERNRISAQLNKSEAEYRNLFQYNPMPMWIFDAETLRFLNVNKAATSHYGYTLAEFQNMSLPDIRLEDGTSHLPGMLTGLEKGGFFESQAQHRIKSGELIDVEIKANLIDFRGSKGVLVLLIDITEKLTREQELIRSNEKFRSAEKIGKLGYWELDMVTEQLYWTEEVYTMLGVATETNLTYDVFSRLVHPDDRYLFNTERQETFQEAREFDLEHRMLRTDGTTIHVYQTGNIIFNELHQAVKFEGIIQDISRRVHYTQTIEVQNRKLLNIAWQQSHVVRAPLSRIMGLVDLLQNHNPTSAEASEFLEHIVSSAKELDVVIKNVVAETDSIDFKAMEKA